MFSKIIGFILYPFARAIRYGALKLMKAMHNPNDRRPLIAAADHMLGEIILPSVFQTFLKNDFREVANFKKLTVAEHDRIFNELQVAGLCLADYYLDTVKHIVKDGDFHFWQGVQEELPRQMQKKLIGYGVDSSNAKLMRQLVEMRYKEYDELAEEVWNASSQSNADFKELPPEMKRLGSMIQGIAIGSADHIRRGKLEKDDPLIKYLTGWLLALQKKVGKFIKKL